MKFSITRVLVVALAAEQAVASSWFTKTPYNKWHETELERWLSDHDVPYPTPADRKDLENIVKENWQSAIESPYANWDTDRLQKYLSDQGKEIKKGTEKNKDELLAQVKSAWHDADAEAHGTYDDIKSWVFNTWTHSALKSFCDRNSIPVPQPRARDQALKAARENYQSVANKAGETAAYPGNWIYEAWTESDLKAWLDKHGVTVPNGSTREKLIAQVRRNSYLARNSLADTASSVTASASGAAQSISDALFDTWSDSQLKEWADKNGIKVPQGSKRNEVLAVLRKQAAKLTGGNVSASASSAYGAATTRAGNEAAGLYNQASSVVMHYYTEVLIAIGFQTNYASSASKSASSVYAKASSVVKGEL